MEAWQHTLPNKQARPGPARLTLSSLPLPAASFTSLGSFFSLALGGLLRSPLGPRGEFLCWAFTAMLRRVLGGRLSLEALEGRRRGAGECLRRRRCFR